MSNDKPRLRFSTIEIHIVKIMVDGIIILHKDVDLTGLLGGHKRRLGICGTEVPQRGPGMEPR